MSVRLLAQAGGGPIDPGQPDTTPPAPPAGIFTDSVTSSSFRLNWTAGPEPDIQDYRAYISATGPSSGFTLDGTIAHPGESYTFSGLTAGTQYWAYVTAVDNAGNESTQSTVVTATTDTSASSDNAARITAIMSGRTPPFAYNTPADPVTTQTINITAGDSAGLAAAVQTAGALINVPAGTYSASLTGWANDVDVVLDNAASITGTIDFGAAARVRLTGGNLNITGAAIGVAYNGASDILFDNVNATFTSMSNEGFSFRGLCNRHAFLNCTLEINGGNSWLIHSRSNAAGGVDFSPYDLIIANCRLNNNSTGAAYRLNPVTRLITVDTLVNDLVGLRTGIRFSAAEDVYLANIIQVGQFHTNFTSTGGGTSPYTWDVNRFTCENLDHYFNLQTFFYSDTVSLGTATIADSVLHSSVGAGTGSPGLGFASDGGGNTQVAWDGSTGSIVYNNLAGKTSASDYGANH